MKTYNASYRLYSITNFAFKAVSWIIFKENNDLCLGITGISLLCKMINDGNLSQ
jgi:hypothetical protein